MRGSSVTLGLDWQQLRHCLGRFATGVTVVTCWLQGRPHGLTVNSFTSVSRQPPLVLVCIARSAKACDAMAGSPFVVNVLRASQRELALHFAGRPQPGLEIAWEPGKVAPRLAGCLAYIECLPWQSYDGGDHVLYLGEVIDFQCQGGDPLLFYGGYFLSLPAEETQLGGGLTQWLW